MPILPSTVTEVTTHIFDPIIEQLLNRLIHRLGYQTIFDKVYINTPYSANSITNDGKNNAQLRSHRMDVDVTYQMNPNSVKWPTMNFNHTAAYGISSTSLKNQNLILSDRDAKVSLYEMNKPCSIIMSCKMKFLDKSLAYQTPAMLSNLYLDGSVLESNDIFFDYQLPGDIVAVLKKLHSLRDLNFDFFQYIKLASSDIIGTTLNKVGDRPELVVKKANLHMLSSIEYTDEQPVDEKTKRRTNSFDVPFTYNIQFNMPSILFLEYPIVIDNKLIPKEYIPLDLVSRAPAHEGNIIVKDVNTYYQIYKRNTGMCYKSPFYEDWDVPSNDMLRHYTQIPFYIGTLLIDNPNEKQIIDLKGDIGDGNTLHPTVLDIIKQQGARTFDFDGIFNISVYKDNRAFDKRELTLDEENMTVSFYTKEKSFIYRLIISQINNVLKLNRDFWDLMFYYRDYLNAAKYLYPLLKKKVPLWQNDGTMWYDRRTGCYHDIKTKKLLFCVDEMGKIYLPKRGKMNGFVREYLNDMTYNPVGSNYRGHHSPIRILRTDITAEG